MTSDLSRAEMDMLSAEYVLGVLEADERARTGDLIGSNGTMRLLSEAWETRFAPMNDGYPVLAAPDVWAGLDRELFAPARRRNRIFLLAGAVLVAGVVIKIAFWARLMM